MEFMSMMIAFAPLFSYRVWPQAHFVKTRGLRWFSLMLLVPIPMAQRVWALPFLTALAPSERYNQQQGRWHKALIDWARQMLVQVRRWLGHRPMVVVADSFFRHHQMTLSTLKSFALSSTPGPSYLAMLPDWIKSS